MIKNYFITALRNLWRNKFFSLINIFGLSLGIACCMIIFLYASDETSFDRFHKKKDRIYRIVADIRDPERGLDHCGSTGMMPGPHFKERSPEIEDYVRVQSAYCDIKKGADIFEQGALWADENFFSVFSFPLLYGDARTALKELQSVVISEDLALKYFGKKNVVGRILQLRTGKEFLPFVVSAVAANSPQNSSINLGFVLPMKFHRTEQDDKQWMNFFLNTFVVLKPNTDAKTTAAKLNRIYLTEAADQIREMKEKYDLDEEITYHLQPFLEMHLSKDFPADNGLSNASNPVYSYILTGIAVFVLLIACINFINLTVARSLKRAKEIGIRKVVGGRRKQLIVQFLGESFILCFLSFILAVCLAVMALPFFNVISNKALAFSYLLDTKLVISYLVLFFITGLMSGFYPAIILSRFSPVQTLYGKLRLSGKNYLSKSLVIFQFVLSTFLIIATVTIYAQFDFMVNYDLGYDKTNVLSVNTANMDKGKLEILKNELRKEPTIRMVTARQSGGYGTVAHINGEKNQEFGYNLVDEETFRFFKIKIVKGRNFSVDTPRDSTESFLVNESFVKAAGWTHPLGEIIDFYYKKKKYTVIGVVKDFHTGPLTEKIIPQVFSTDPELKYGVVYVKLKPGNKLAGLQHAEKTFKTMFPMQPYRSSFLDEDLVNQYTAEAKWKQIISFSALLTIFISCIGLFGLAALSAEKRTKEIGIRKVLGASVGLISRKLSEDFLKLVAIAVCIALPAAWWVMNKWLENYPYRITIKPLMLLSTVLIVVIIALITVSYQAVKAALANPVNSLRTE